MNEYSDIKIIECNRLHSEEAKGDPLRTENTSLWTNNLQDIVHLEPGDKVSVYGSFISERGAGQQTSIEVKGVELGTTQTLQYEVLNGSGVWKDHSARYKEIESVFTRETFNLRDDTGRFTISYYIPANAHNSIQTPRRWINGEATPRDQWVETDSRTVGGMSLWYPERGGFYLPNNFYNCLQNVDAETPKKQRHDNSRYTILVRSNTYFDPDTADGNLPAVNERDPEFDPGSASGKKGATYRTYKELKEIEVPAGFNSPEFIATEITRQIQKLTDNDILKMDTPQNSNKYPISAIKTLASETYKPFMSANYNDMTKELFEQYFNLESATSINYRAGWINGSGAEWLRQYQFVATKYPELFEKGRLINRNGAELYTGSFGSQTLGNISKLDNIGIICDIPYNKTMCDQFLGFFKAQKLYPEIWDNFKADNFYGNGGYNPGSDLTNSRFIHFNKYSNASQRLGASEDATLGWGGYHNPRTWTPGNTESLCSLFTMLFFDPEQEDIFYPAPNEDRLEFTYGCLGRSPAGNIIIYPNRHEKNGFGTNAYNELFKFGETIDELEGGRKFGFDLHYTAPGMSYILPYAGWSRQTNPTSSVSAFVGNYFITDAQTAYEAKNPPAMPAQNLPVLPEKNQLYLGADNPTLAWDGTHFSLKNLHTSQQRGNQWHAGDPIFGGTVDPDAGDIVYKINPDEQFVDFSPDRKPISGTTATHDYKKDAINVPYLNSNLEAWKIYDYLTGIFIEDFAIDEKLWEDSLWGILGFTYKQFHDSDNNRQTRIQFGNANKLSKPTTNAEVVEGDTKIYITNHWGTPMFNNMIPSAVNVIGHDATGSVESYIPVYPPIIHKTQSISLIADNLPTRMIRGYYTIRSNLLEDNPFVGGKKDNTKMPVIGVVDKINGDGDFYFGQESSLIYTITKPLRIASVSVSVHDPDGSYARTSKQSTILFKIEKDKRAVFNQVQQLIQESQGTGK